MERLPHLAMGPRGVILAADSRWTYDDGRTEDDAVKAFQLAENVIACYSGRAGTGEHLLDAVARSLGPTNTIEEVYERAGATMEDAYKECQGTGELHILLALSGARGWASRAHFRASDHFRPRQVPLLFCIAPEPVKTYCEQALRAMPHEAKSSASPDLPPSDIASWGALLSGLLNEVSEMNLHPSVGGSVTCLASIAGRVAGTGATLLHPGSSGVRTKRVNLGARGKTVKRVWSLVPPSEKP